MATQDASQQKKQMGKIAKFKSVISEVEEAVSTWKQPLRRHVNHDNVRVLNGDAEHDFHARFTEPVLTVSTICKAIAEKEQLSEQEAQLFSLWVIAKDLELQIRPDQDIFGLMIFWNKWMLKYTHFPEAENAQHRINHHWFVYRREASISISEEQKWAGTISNSLLFGEAKRNILTGRYACNQLEASTLAGFQLQISYGDFNETRCKPGYLIENGRLNQLLPIGMSEKMRPSQWEEIITVQYKTFLGLTINQVRQQFLEFARKMPCYGASMFPACAELPPSGFFEYRIQNWFIAVGPNGVSIIDFDTQKYVHVYQWKDLRWKTGPDVFTLIVQKNGRIKDMAFITPQTKIIGNLCTKMKYKWAKEAGLLKSNVAIEIGTLDKKGKLIKNEVSKKEKKDNWAMAKQVAVTVDNIRKNISPGFNEKLFDIEKLQNQNAQDIIIIDSLNGVFPNTILPLNYTPTPTSAATTSNGNLKSNPKATVNNVQITPVQMTTPSSASSDRPLLNPTPSSSPTKSSSLNMARGRVGNTENLLLANLEEVNPKNQNTNNIKTHSVSTGSMILSNRQKGSNYENELLTTLEEQNPSKPTPKQPASPFAKRASAFPANIAQKASSPLAMRKEQHFHSIQEKPSTDPRYANATVQFLNTEKKLQYSQSQVIDQKDIPYVSTGSINEGVKDKEPHPPLDHSKSALESNGFIRTTRMSELGTFVKPSKRASVRKSSGIQINKRSSQLFNFDDHLGGIGPTQLIDKRTTSFDSLTRK